MTIRILTKVFAQRPSYPHRSYPPTPAFLECLGDFDSVLWQTLLEDMLGGVPVLSKEELCQPTSQARLPIAHGGFSLLNTTILAPIAFLGLFALATPALESTSEKHNESLGPILCDVELGALSCMIRSYAYIMNIAE